MTGDPERDKLNENAARIRWAEKRAIPAVRTAPDNADVFSASRIGFDFVATLAVCAGAGWLVDREFSTGPWGLLAMTAVGFAAGMVHVWRALGARATDGDK